MKRWLSLLVLLGSAPGLASAAIVNVGGTNNGYSPQTLTINAGDSVTFVNKGGVHNVVADDGSFRCARGCDGDGHGGSGNAASSNWIASVKFDTPGTFGYFCEVHGMPGRGMFGTVTVQGAAPPPKVPDPIPMLDAKLLALLVGVIAASALRMLLRRRRR